MFVCFITIHLPQLQITKKGCPSWFTKKEKRNLQALQRQGQNCKTNEKQQTAKYKNKLLQQPKQNRVALHLQQASQQGKAAI